jgi:GNAT superfamily N-acetyltransferase
MTAILPAGRNDVVTSIRPLTEADIEAAGQVQVAAFDDLDRRMGEKTPPISAERWKRVHGRIRHFLIHDPGGSWVSTSDDGAVTGVALASVRGDLWGLSLLVVKPGGQSGGAGRQLLNATLGYAEGCDRAVILASRDPRAVRLYATSGFDLYPQMAADGVPDLQQLPETVSRVRPLESGDASLLERIDQQVRRATRGPDHELLGRNTGFVCDDDAGSGYAYVTTDGGYLTTLVACDERTASDLLWRCLQEIGSAGLSANVSDLGANQQWAMRVALQARLALNPRGPVLWRGGSPPPAYLPSGALL